MYTSTLLAAAAALASLTLAVPEAAAKPCTTTFTYFPGCGNCATSSHTKTATKFTNCGGCAAVTSVPGVHCDIACGPQSTIYPGTSTTTTVLCSPTP